jgi:hypothetical protein
LRRLKKLAVSSAVVTAPLTALCVSKGTCYALFAYEVGLAIDLDRCERQVTALTQRQRLKQRRRAPQYFDYRPAPLRVIQDAEPLRVGAYQTAESAELVLYDFGAVSVMYSIPFSGPLVDLIELTQLLYDNACLREDSLRRVTQLLHAAEEAVARPRVADFVETYAILQIEAFTQPCPPADLYTTHAQTVAQILRSERAPLSADEVRDAMAQHIAYGTDDVTIIDWDVTLLFDRDAEDVRAVLEFANVELLEMRYLDQQLDDALDESYVALWRRTRRRVRMPGSRRADLRRVAQLQVDNAVLFEGVNNALKLLGDQYLARLYRLASDRFHLVEWDASILRKLQTLESIYEKMADTAANWRLEVLEMDHHCPHRRIDRGVLPARHCRSLMPQDGGQRRQPARRSA